MSTMELRGQSEALLVLKPGPVMKITSVASVTRAVERLYDVYSNGFEIYASQCTLTSALNLGVS